MFVGFHSVPFCHLQPGAPTQANVCVWLFVVQGSEKQSEVRIKKFMTMMDSMTEKELNTNDIKLLQQPTRVARISRGAGRTPHDYFELLGASQQCLHGCMLSRFCFLKVPGPCAAMHVDQVKLLACLKTAQWGALAGWSLL